MIIIERTITIKNDQATLDSPIYLYRGDGDIVCLFTIKEMKKAATFGKIEANNPVSQASYGNVRIYKPDGSKCVFTEKSPIVDDKLQVTFSYENINDFTEVGVHKLQIHLYDDNDAHNESNDKNRFTLPPIDINVLLPVGDDNNQIDEAVVGYSLLNAVDEDVPTFDEEGNYNKTIWETGDIITQGKLNKIEDALYEISTADDNYVTNEVLEAELGGIETALKGKANVSHRHSEYASTNHNHSEYATRTELNNKANTNHSHTGYATTNHNHTGYAASDHTHIDYAASNHTHSDYLTQSALSNYATKSYVDNSGFLTSIPSAYVTEGELDNILATKTYATVTYVNTAIQNAGGFSGGGEGLDPSVYATKIELDAKADKTHTHNEYLTEIPATYATKSYVDDAVRNIEDKDIDLSNYPTIDVMNEALTNKADSIHTHSEFTNFATTDHTHEDYALKTEIPDMVTVPTNVSAFTNDAGYITDEAITPINEAIDSINESINDLDQNLNDYALKTDIPTIPTKLSAFTNDAKYISSNTITGIEIVEELPPENEQRQGVLYIVKE